MPGPGGALLAILLAFFVAPPPLARGGDLAGIQKLGSLRVIFMDDPRQPEFFSAAENGPPGLDREILAAFAGLQRLKLEIVPVTSWDALVPALLEDKGDMIAGRFTVTPSRLKRIDFTEEVFPTRNAVITRRPHRVVRSVEELRSERVGTIRGTSLAEALAAAGVPPANVDDGVPVGGIAEALRSGRVTAAVWGVEAAIAAQRKDPDLQVGLFLGPPASLAYGVRKDEPQLLGALNQYIVNLHRTPTWDRLVVKYFGDASLDILRKARGN